MPFNSPRPAQFRSAHLPTAIVTCLYVVVVLKTAWICDDAYITFRTMDNVVAGHGLVWNVAERVQVYTHPLWMLLLVPLHWLTHEPYYSCLLLSVLLSVATVLLLAARVAVAALPALIGVTILTLSKAFVDYSTSGLENPLLHFLLVLFALACVAPDGKRKRLSWLALLAALIALTRLDALLLVMPALVAALARQRNLRSLGVVVLGLSPLVLWELFALFYYGSLVPNTAYAKLHTGLAGGTLFRQGLFYVLATLEADPLTVVAIGAGLATPMITRQREHLPLAFGALLYILYVICVGGDFMLGRFLSAPLLVAVILLTRARVTALTGVIMLLLVFLIGVVPARSPIRSSAAYGVNARYMITHGIGDERAFYYQATGLLLAAHKPLPDHAWAEGGRAARARAETLQVVDPTVGVGMYGFFAGPGVHVLGQLGLTDPLLARSEPAPVERWRIGHFRRDVPAGYVETLLSGENRLSDPLLASYYDKLRFITRGELWDLQRWLEIVKLNLGFYDDMLAASRR